MPTSEPKSDRPSDDSFVDRYIHDLLHCTAILQGSDKIKLNTMIDAQTHL